MNHCDLLILRYVPNLVKDERLNLGLVFFDRSTGTIEVRFTRDWRRLRCLDPDADVEMLEALETELRSRLQTDGEDRDRVFHLLKDSFANAVQVSSVNAIAMPEGRTAAEELKRLEAIYLRTPKRHTGTGARRTAILGRMREAFTEKGVWDLLTRDFPVEQFTHPGDPMKLDCSYRPRVNGVIRHFHAVSLLAGVNAAKVLAYSFPQVREGIARALRTRAELTAIVEPNLPRSDQEIAFALSTLEHASILVATTNDLPVIAARARDEL